MPKLDEGEEPSFPEEIDGPNQRLASPAVRRTSVAEMMPSFPISRQAPQRASTLRATHFGTNPPRRASWSPASDSHPIRIARSTKLGSYAKSELDSSDALERIDEEGTTLLVKLWTEAEQLRLLMRQSSVRRGARRFLWGGFQRNGSVAADWLKESQWTRYFIHLFFMADFMPLPRAVCLYRYKAPKFRAATTISDWDFGLSLRRAGFGSDIGRASGQVAPATG